MTQTPSGLEALLAVRPQWTRLAPASQVLALEGRWLLHAGPPLADPHQPPAPILSSAVLACLYEGWAQTEAEAEQLVRSGAVQFSPAQDHHCATPLAALVSPSTTLIVMEDAGGAVAPVFAPLGAIGGPDLRFGTRDRAILDRLKLRDGAYAHTLTGALTTPVDLLPIAAKAVTEGDDLHNRTTAATAALAETLAQRYGRAAVKGSGDLLQGLAATPLFFLTFWMAAAKLMLSAAENKLPATLVTRMAGNGEVFGLSLAGKPDAWITMPATAPQGPRLPNANAASAALGAIGDSAVIDALGFGGQALHLAPEPHGALQPFLPAGAFAPAMPHPAFLAKGVRVGLDAAAVANGDGAPVVTLGMVEKTGREGLLGRGVFLPGKALFESAVWALDQ